MPLSEEERDMVDAFREYLQGTVAADDRYGTVTHADSDDGAVFAIRFEANSICWFEVAVEVSIPRIRVGFLTTDESLGAEAEEVIQDSGETLQSHVGESFRHAGLDWVDPPVERIQREGEYFCYATPLPIDEIPDLEWDDVRGKVVRMLEGYLIAFGPAIEVADHDDDDEDEDEDEL